MHLAEMAKLAAEKLGDARAAIAIWNRVLEEDAADPMALAQLAALYEREKRWAGLAEVYHRQREAVRGADGEDARAAVAVLERLGALYAEKLEAPAQATAVFKEILALQPGHAKAVRVLRDLYTAAGELDALVELYGALAAWDDLIEVLHGVADRAPTSEAKLAVLGRIPRIAGERAGAPEKAAKANERILSIDPQNLAAARALVPIYRDQGKWARLLGTYEVLLAHTPGADDKLALYVEIRKLCEEKLGSKTLAFQWCARAYEAAPAGAEARDGLLRDLQRLAAEADAWEQVAEIFDRRVAAEGVPAEEKLRLLRELGRIRAVRLHRPDDARAAWERVLALAPDDPEAVQALEDLAIQQGRWADLLVTHRRKAERIEDPARRLEMLFKIAFIEEERVADLEAAAATYQQILALDPRSQRALRALSKVQGARGDAAGLARALELELESAAEPEDKVGLLLRLGGLHEEKLSQPKKALEAFRAALALAPTNRQVHAGLEKFLAGSGEERAEAAALLVPVYERFEDPKRLAPALEILRAAEPDRAERLALDRRLVALYARKLKDPLGAYEAATRVLAGAPDDADNRRELGAMAAELSAYDDLALHLEKAVAGGADRPEGALEPRVVHDLSTELAEIYDEKLVKPAEAEVAWRRVLDIDAADERAHDALARLLRAAGRWDDLRALLLYREENTLDAAKRREILLQICDLYEGVLDNPAGAMEAYRRVLDVDPTLVRGYKALERLYDAAERWPELEDLLGRELAHVKDEREALALGARRAELRANRMGDAHGAVDLAEEVIARDPGHRGVRELLEVLFRKADLKLRIARLLAPRYEAEGDWGQLIAMLRGEREFAAHPSEAVDLLARIAGLQEARLGDEPGAFDTWTEALHTDPEDKRPRAALERLARRLGRCFVETDDVESEFVAI